MTRPRRALPQAFVQQPVEPLVLVAIHVAPAPAFDSPSTRAASFCVSRRACIRRRLLRNSSVGTPGATGSGAWGTSSAPIKPHR